MNTPETATAAEAAVTTAEIASVATAETAAKAAAEISAKTDPQHASMPALKEHILPNLRIFGFILLGSLLYSLGLNLFYRPSQLLSGGLTGIAMLLNYQFGFSTSLMVILLNIPMFILGFFLISRRFVLESLVGMLIFTGSIELFKNLSLPFNSPVTAIVLGGFAPALLSEERISYPRPSTNIFLSIWLPPHWLLTVSSCWSQRLSMALTRLC